MPFRGFIAIDIDSNDEIRRFSESLESCGARLKLVELENLHVTLKFLGETREEIIDEIEECMRFAVKNVKPFKIELGGVGVFPNMRRINVVWIGVKGDELKGIFERLDESLEKLGYGRERREFSPHLTIARVKGIDDKEKLISILKDYANKFFGEQIVNSLKLKKSTLTKDGPIYSTVREVKMEES